MSPVQGVPGPSPRSRRSALRAVSALGVAVLAVTVAMELADAEPAAQVWAGAAAGALFLAATTLTAGDDAGQLATRARLLVGAGVAVVLAVVGLWQVSERSEPRVLLLLAPAALLFTTAVLALREAGSAGRRLRAAQLRHQLVGEERERRRWARELHDQTLQDLAAMDVRVGSLLAAGREDGTPAEALLELRGMLRDQMASLRYLVNELRPLALDSLGLRAALRGLADRVRDVGDLEVRCDVDALPDALPPDLELAVYRVVQEALTNVVRHAGATHVALEAGVRDGALVVRVRDDGTGFDPDAVPARADGTGHGLTGMRDRAAAFGADLRWSRPDGGGTLVTLALDDVTPA